MIHSAAGLHRPMQAPMPSPPIVTMDVEGYLFHALQELTRRSRSPRAFHLSPDNEHDRGSY
jgi:hypothetical protein